MQLDRTNQNRIVGAGTALSGVVSLALLANPITDILGLAFLFSGLGYSIATQLMAGWTRDQERQWAQKHGALASREQALKTARTESREEIAQQREGLAQARAEIAEEIKQVNHRHQSYQAELKAAFDSEVAQATELLGNEARERIAALETEYTEKLSDADRKALARIKKHKSQHREHERQLHARIAELEATVVEHDTYLKAEFDKVLGDTDALLAGEIKGVQLAKAAAMEDIQQRDLIIERLKGLVEANGAPKKFRGSSADDQIANRVIDLLLQAGIKVSGDNWDRRYSQLILWVESAIAVTTEIECQLENIQLALGLYNRPTVALERGLYKIVLDTDAKGTATKGIKIVNPALSRLESALDSSIHLRIVAPSGSGKTVLLGNFINYCANTYLKDYTLSDPKVTAPENWGNLKPAYYSRECLDHYFGLAETALTRIDMMADAVKNSKPIPQFEPQFHIIDELEFLYGLAEITDPKKYSSKAFKTNTKAMLKVGREHRMKMLFVTQSPLPIELNLRKDDLENCSSIFLGSGISKALNGASDNDGLLRDVPSDLIAKLKAEYKARLTEINELKNGQSDDFHPPQEWIYLFFNPAKPHDLFMGLCPPPGHYSTGTGETANPQKTAPSTAQPLAGAVSETQLGEEVQPCTGKSAATALAPTSTALSTALSAGTHCPNCGSHTATYAKKLPNGKGNVSVRCKNAECTTKTFSWKPI